MFLSRKESVFITGGFLVLFLASITYVLLVKPSAWQDKSKRFNVVVIVADALRHDVLGCYGGDADTPSIDWLASKGATFENAYSTSSCTIPSAISLMTGNYPTAYGVAPFVKEMKAENWLKILYVQDAERLLSETLKELDYDLKMSIENNSASGPNIFQGFEKLSPRDRLSPADIELIEKVTGMNKTEGDGDQKSLSKYGRCYELLHFLLHHDTRRNFFVVKWFLDPHAPYDPPERFKKNIPLDPSRLREEEDYYSLHSAYDFKKLSDYEVGYLKELYKAEVASIDERIAFIIEALRDKKLMDETYIIFTSDHGEMFGEHNRLNHGGLFFEELVHVPLIIFGPGIKAGIRVKTYVSHLDLMPTLKDLLGVRYPLDTQGESFSPVLFGDAIEDRVLLFEQTYIEVSNSENNKAQALIMKGHKLFVQMREGKTVFSLYDLGNDPEESENLYRKKKDLADGMYQEILRINKEKEKRRKRSVKEIEKEIDFVSLSEETIEQLRALGYIQ